MDSRRYFISVLIASLTLVAAAWILAWWLEPLYGDLTRIGGYAERHFGANAPMQEFKPLAASWGKTYDRPADVLVIGDSFANGRPAQQWQNWLAVRTGWTIHTLNSNNLELDAKLRSPKLDALLESAMYRRFPPSVVIWNVVERDLLDEYGKGPLMCEPSVPPAAVRPLERRATALAAITSDRPRLAGLNPGFARVWAWRATFRQVLGINTTDAVRFSLARDDLFTSRFPDELLIFRNDLRKSRWKPPDLARIRCGIADLAARIQSNRVTRLVTAVAPDKSTAYRPWVAFPPELPESRLTTLLDEFPVPDARLDRALASAIAVAIKDVYMPDDTHWNATGQKLVADAILEMLIAEGVTK